MESVYDYKNNIKVIETCRGDVVITMNKEAHTILSIALYEAAQRQKQEGRTATAQDTDRLREAI